MSNTPAAEPRQVLNQFVIAVLALVVGSAVLFFAIGKVGASPDDSSEPVATATATATATPTTAATTPPAAAETTPPPATEAPAEVVTPPAATTPAAPAAEAPTEAPVTPTSEPTSSNGIDPATIKVQVLDAKLDGSTTASEVADQMEADGYDLIAEGRAGTAYDQTTLFYGDGQEQAAQQIANQYGWSAIRPNTVGLSTSVDVSVLVGRSD